MDLSNWKISDYAAWWGAVIATLALIWNIVNALRSGPRIYVSAIQNMQFLPQGKSTESKTFISVTAVNRGTAPTTITHFSGFYANTIWNLIRKKKRQNFIVKTGSDVGNILPYVLNPGQEWSSMADKEDIQKKYTKGYLFLGVIHNQRKRPVYVRVHL